MFPLIRNKCDFAFSAVGSSNALACQVRVGQLHYYIIIIVMPDAYIKILSHHFSLDVDKESILILNEKESFSAWVAEMILQWFKNFVSCSANLFAFIHNFWENCLLSLQTFLASKNSSVVLRPMDTIRLKSIVSYMYHSMP